ncbi:hypothetical protein QYM36_007069 [Artemia franciscana]|uniref:Uncharacterized protein n=1 Tax=Artemia franciscana TaxID=6661 RepID=A0AA88HYT5_ARTSF|nr:hypothetical protein QYM36_007069 [Artemia franciscana]
MSGSNRLCILCQQDISSDDDTSVVLTVKGALSVSTASKDRGDQIAAEPGQIVHKACRKDFCRQSTIYSLKRTSEEPIPNETPRKLRSHDFFNVQVCCIFCNYEVGFEKSIRKGPTAKEKENDSAKAGRPAETKKREAFEKSLEHFKSIEDQHFTLSDVAEKMNSFLGVGEAYSVKPIQRLLLESYGDRVLITDLPGKASIVTFRETAHFILNEHRTLPKDRSEDVEIMNMIKTVARIIKNESKSLPPLSEEYPSFKSLDNVETCLSYLPKSLRLLLCELIPGENENIAVAALGQAIVQTCLPRTVLAALQIPHPSLDITQPMGTTKRQ